MLILLDLEDLYLPLIFLGIAAHKKLQKQKLLIRLGIAISIGSTFSTLFLTNLGFNHALKYMVLGVCILIVAIGQWVRENSLGKYRKWIFKGVLYVIVFRNAFLIQPKLTNYNRNIFELLEERNKVKSGPAIGIYSDYMGPYVMNQNMQDWKRFVKPGDNLIIVGGQLTCRIGY